MLDLNEELITIDASVNSWQEAAQAAGRLLLKKNLIEPEFIDSIIETVNKFGPYMILVPKVCFFHGEPGEMVHEPCLSLVTLKNEVRFTEFDNQPIKCAFAFGATDPDSHLDMIKSIASLLADEEFIELITNNGEKEKIIKKIKELEK